MTDFQQFSNTQIFGGSNSSNMMDPMWSTQAKSSMMWSPASNFVQQQQPSFDPKRVPTSVKNSQFINISNTPTTQDPWMVAPITNIEKQSPVFFQQQQQQLLKKKDVSPLSSSSDDTIQQISQQFAQQQITDENGDIEEEINGQSRYKTELCRSFAETGICRYGFKCQFAHGRDELRPVMRHPKYKTETCKTFHTVGSCPYGSRCRFIHSKPTPAEKVELAQNTEQFANTLAQQQSPPPQQPIKQNPLQSPPKVVDLSAPINWTESWGPDESVMPTVKIALPVKQPTAPSPIKEEESTKRRLQIFRTICASSASWE